MEQRRRKTLLGRFTIASVFSIILFTAFTSQFFVICPYLQPWNPRSFIILSTLNLSILMMLINYILTCTTDPGKVPDKWMPRQQAYIEVKKSTHTPRFCRTCKNFKPPRSHHCSRCGRCVLKMDHHCPWVNNCIGFANYGHFIRLIILIDISAGYVLALLICRVVQLISKPHDSIQLDIAEIVFMSFNMLITAAAFLAIGTLSCYHLFYISTNTTTIEAWEKGKSLAIKGLGTVKDVKYPYNQGVYKNLTAVLGPWPIFWLLPQSTTTGNGLDFSINDAKFHGSEHVDTNYDDDSLDDPVANTQCLNSSTTHLNRTLSIASSYTSKEGNLTFATNDTSMQTTPGSVNVKATESLSRTRESVSSFEGYYPDMPESIITFSTNATTLIGEQHDVSCVDYSATTTTSIKSTMKFELKEISEHDIGEFNS